MLLNILQFPKEKLKVNNLLNELNNVKQIPKRIDKIINNYKDDVFSYRIGNLKMVRLSYTMLKMLIVNLN